MPKFRTDKRNRFLDIDVTADKDTHIVGHIVRIEVILDVNQGRVFQVFDGTNCRLLAIRMNFPEKFIDCRSYDPASVIKGTVFFLVYGFQLSMKQPKHRIHEPIRFNLHPLV